MRFPKPGGVGQYFDELGVREVHASTCAHCNNLTEFPSMKEMHKYVDVCRNCMKLICLREECRECIPFIKKIEEQEERYYRQRQMEKL